MQHHVSLSARIADLERLATLVPSLEDEQLADERILTEVQARMAVRAEQLAVGRQADLQLRHLAQLVGAFLDGDAVVVEVTGGVEETPTAEDEHVEVTHEDVGPITLPLTDLKEPSDDSVGSDISDSPALDATDREETLAVEEDVHRQPTSDDSVDAAQAMEERVRTYFGSLVGSVTRRQIEEACHVSQSGANTILLKLTRAGFLVRDESSMPYTYALNPAEREARNAQRAETVPVTHTTLTVMPAGLNGEERAVFDLIRHEQHGLTAKLVAARLNWTYSRTNGVIGRMVDRYLLRGTNDRFVAIRTSDSAAD
ncbi:hypothetical protein [Deinococcus pimensis]|uniref:hypothetical protein n=1 Tax=Deinococcus pimensis TaxID=309888 RepID=UPI000482F99B|nr:hypothetical protein [Deinococcus pimensis]